MMPSGRAWLRWALETVVCLHLTVARVAGGLEVAWNTASDTVLAEGKGFTGFKTAAAGEHPDAVAVMDPFHVVRLADDALDPSIARRGPTRVTEQLSCVNSGSASALVA